MARRKPVDVSRFLDAAAVPPETPAQKQSRIMEARQNVENLRGAIDAGQNTTAREKAILSRMHQRIKSTDLDMRDLMTGIRQTPGVNPHDLLLPEDRAILAGRTSRAAGQMLTEEFPTAHDNMLMEDDTYAQPTQPPARHVTAQPVQRRPLREDIAAPRQSAPDLHTPIGANRGENWTVKQYLGETRDGSKVHVWKVENSRTGSKLDTMFRVASVASRIALMLNESGDINDPRAVSLISAYNKRDKLLKEARQLQKSADGKPMKSERLRAIQAEINQLDYRLGI